MPSLLIELFKESSSPYINRFLSADTIVPGYANPQNLNRFSYVNNNPLRYTDPTGHMQVQDGPQQDRFKPSVADKYRPRPRRSGNRGQSQQQEVLNDFAEFFLTDERLGSFGTREVDSAEFEKLLSLIGRDLRTIPPELLPFLAMSYDTPFYNHGGQLSGTGCINGECYDRSEINYIAEGELWAATGLPKPVGHLIVRSWKACPFICGHSPGSPSPGTLEMFDVGYDYYKQQYPAGTPRAPYMPIMPWKGLGSS